jgi:hypothetical protein
MGQKDKTYSASWIVLVPSTITDWRRNMNDALTAQHATSKMRVLTRDNRIGTNTVHDCRKQEQPMKSETTKDESIEVTMEQKLNAALKDAAEKLSLAEALTIIPNAFGEKLLGALTRKYDQKYGKLPAEQSAHREQFPQYAGNTAMLYVLVSARQEAEEKIASETRIENVSNLKSMVNAYTQAEVLTEFQVKQNEAIDLQVTNLKDKIANSTEGNNCLKAVRGTWIKSLDYGYIKAQDNKLRRACHIFGTTIEAIAR